MDADSADTGAGVTDSLNGETKPDPAKLAQTAIIKQDVMLSGTSTQSPLSSVLTMPTISMPTSSMPHISMGAMGTSIPGTLADNLFLSSTVPSMSNNDPSTHTQSINETNKQHDITAASINHAASALSQQLLGQPPVAPQFIMTGQGLPGHSAGAAPSMPVQQLLIPVSTGNGTQQFVTIPVSMAPGNNQQIQLLTTSNGQIIATNLSSLTQQLGLPLANSAAGGATSVNTTSSQTPSLSLNNGLTNQAPAAHQPTTPSAASLPQLITNAQGQILAIGAAPQVAPSTQSLHPAGNLNNHQFLQQSLSNAAASTTTATSSIQHSTPPMLAPHAALTQQSLHSVAPSLSVTQPTHSLKPALSSALSSLSQQALHTVSLPQASAHNLKMEPIAAAATAQTIQAAVATQSSAAIVPQQVVAAVTQASTNSLPPNVNQLLPNTDTVSNSTESTTVDGINLDEIKEFAKQFKIRRLSLGLTQTQVGQALSATEGPAYSQSAICSAAEGRPYSQSAICRFEKLDITPKSAQKIKPVLEKWMKEAEERYKNGVQNLTDFIGSEPSKKRKRRTSFTPQAIEVLNEFFERNTHPSGAEMTQMAEQLNYDRAVVRVWFCNKRQSLKNTIKKLKSGIGS